jgi:hypothetical protein
MNQMWMMPLILLAVCLLATVQVYSKEIEATHEWQALGVNDTVAAGMHIRIDMTTGEKWVKLPDDDGTSDSTRSSTKAESSKLESMQISAVDGEASLIVGNDGHDKGQYDYEMMFRALSKLPDDEKKKMGLPDDASDKEKLKEIWARRQEILRDVVVADLPEILKERTQALREFKAKPLAALHEVQDNTILALVKDLEYLLQDIDMTRDFHTLGGWIELASLLSDDVIQQAIKTERQNRTEGFIEFSTVIDNIHLLQANAAWALGTAVKNTAEFSPYVLEYVSEPIKGKRMTVLELVTSHIRNYTERRTLPSAEEQQKMNKMVYCLGSFLGGKDVVQERFLDYDGPAVVEKALIKAAADYVSSQDASNVKLFDRLLKIVADIASFGLSTTPELCTAIESASVLPDRTTYLHGVLAYATSCPLWREDASKVKLNVRSVLEEELSKDDDDYRLATAILQVLETKL